MFAGAAFEVVRVGFIWANTCCGEKFWKAAGPNRRSNETQIFAAKSSLTKIHCAWAKYELAKPGSLKLLPPASRLSEVEKDYQAMQAMVFDKSLSFSEIIESLSQLEKEINALAG